MNCGRIDNPNCAPGRVWLYLNAHLGEWVGSWDVTAGARTSAASTQISAVREQLPPGFLLEHEQRGREHFYRLSRGKTADKTPEHAKVAPVRREKHTERDWLELALERAAIVAESAGEADAVDAGMAEVPDTVPLAWYERIRAGIIQALRATNPPTERFRVDVPAARPAALSPAAAAVIAARKTAAETRVPVQTEIGVALAGLADF